jgi:hypothetical protein
MGRSPLVGRQTVPFVVEIPIPVQIIIKKFIKSEPLATEHPKKVNSILLKSKTA